MRRALDDDGDHRAAGMARAEQPHLLVDGGARGGDRRADDDERGPGIERGNGGAGHGVRPGSNAPHYPTPRHGQQVRAIPTRDKNRMGPGDTFPGGARGWPARSVAQHCRQAARVSSSAVNVVAAPVPDGAREQAVGARGAHQYRANL